ncbi:hypothetical protein AB996_0706 [Lactococcus cremoris]|uniref:Uncharacterized protein n=1 Tax=Lactococcus lactis subsp. cremoris TaxID=1359 RepID=A0A166K6L1_LACLC|nr:hypothetical protein AB996_0706 [Lactococcus cremoris]
MSSANSGSSDSSISSLSSGEMSSVGSSPSDSNSSSSTSSESSNASLSAIDNNTPPIYSETSSSSNPASHSSSVSNKSSNANSTSNDSNSPSSTLVVGMTKPINDMNVKGVNVSDVTSGQGIKSSPLSTQSTRVSTMPNLENPISISRATLPMSATVTTSSTLPDTGSDDSLSAELAILGLGLIATLTIGEVKYKKVRK